MRWAIDELLGTRCGKGLPAAVLIWGLLARVTLGQSGAEDVDVAFTFIDRAAEATEHFNEGRAAEALAIFQGLLEKYPDQDADGYVSLSIGDCLFALDRFDEAVAAYQRTVIQQFESICALNLPDRFLINRLASRADKSPRIVAERAQAEQVLRTSDGQRYQVQVRVDAPGSDGQVIINGRPVPLTDAQRKLIQRHYDRINQIYLEAYLDAARQ